MITIDIFNQLTELEQLNTIIIEGQPIGESADNQYHLFLYRVAAFYVTVTYCADTDKLLSIRAFQPYNRTIPAPSHIAVYVKGGAE